MIISYSQLEEGRSLLLTANEIQFILGDGQFSGIEKQDQPNHFSFNEDEMSVELLSYNLDCFSQKSVKFIKLKEDYSREFPDSIWQPPKSV